MMMESKQSCEIPEGNPCRSRDHAPPEDKPYTPPEGNPCWGCVHAVPDGRGRGCPWSVRFEPVPGWTARPVSHAGIDSYQILRCPLFQADGRRTRQRRAVIATDRLGTETRYPSLTAAAQALGLGPGNICWCCKGRLPRCGGLSWRYG